MPDSRTGNGGRPILASYVSIGGTYPTICPSTAANIWWVKIRVDGHPVYESSKSTKKSDAIQLRDKLIAKRHRGEISGGAPDKVLVNEFLDDVLRSDIKDTTRYIREKVVGKNVRPFFGDIRAARLSTDQMEDYRQKRKAEGRRCFRRSSAAAGTANNPVSFQPVAA